MGTLGCQEGETDPPVLELHVLVNDMMLVLESEPRSPLKVQWLYITKMSL